MLSASRSHKVTLVAALIVAVIVAGLTFLGLDFLSKPFFESGGSDSLVTLLEPSRESRALACVILAAAIVSFAIARSRGRRLVQGILVLVAVIALIQSGHRVALDGLRGEIRDSYFLLKVARLPFDVTNGPQETYDLSKGRYFVGLRSKDSNPSASIFLGLPPWHLDVTPLTNHWARE